MMGLSMMEAIKSQRMQAVSKSWKIQENIFSLLTKKKYNPANTVTLTKWNLLLTFNNWRSCVKGMF